MQVAIGIAEERHPEVVVVELVGLLEGLPVGELEILGFAASSIERTTRPTNIRLRCVCCGYRGKEVVRIE